MQEEFVNPEKQINIAGVGFQIQESGDQHGGQASLHEAVIHKSDVSRRFLVKRFYENGEPEEELYESEILAQTAAANHHQAVLASVLYDRVARTSVMLKASSDCQTLQELMHEWEEQPPKDPASDYYDMGRLLESIQIAKSLLGILDGIHNDEKKPMLHMDLSPSNIMWGRNKAHGTAYVIDFSCCTKTGSIVGERRRTTLSFSAPETQIPGAVLTPAADIYSVGAVFLLLVAGMTGASNTQSEKKWHARKLPGKGNLNVTEPIGSLEIPDAYKGKLSEIIVKATTSVDKRYQSASDMLKDLMILEEIVREEGVHLEVLRVKSEKHYAKTCRKDLDPELFVEAISHSKPGKTKIIFDKDLGAPLIDPGWEKLIDCAGKEHCTLIADGGSGKTTALYNLWKYMLDRQNESDASVPLYVDLAGFTSLVQSPWYIHDCILRDYAGSSHETVESQRIKLTRLFQGGKFAIILDGYNEAQNPEELDEEIGKLAGMSGVKLIVASRFAPHNRCFAKFSRFSLPELSGDIVDQKVSACGKVVRDARLHYVLQKPMYLAAYIDLDKDKSPETPGRIIYEHVLKLKEKAKDLGHSLDYDLRDFAVEEALPLLAYHADTMTVDYKWAKCTLEKNISGERLDRIGNQRHCVRVLDCLCHMGILQKMENEKYHFAHQNYRDVFQSVYIANQLKQGITNESLTTMILDPESAAFLSDVLCEDEHRSTNAASSSCIGRIIASLRGKNDYQTQLVLCNLVEVLKISRNNRLNICFDDCDLSLVDFQGCDLSGSTFRNAKLPVVGFLRRGHLRSVTSLFQIPGTNSLLSYSQDENKICVWDIKTGRLQKTIWPYLSKEGTSDNRVAVSPDGKLVAIRNCSTVELYSIVTGDLVKRLDVGFTMKLKEKVANRLKSMDQQTEICRFFSNILCFCGAKKLIVNVGVKLVTYTIDGKAKRFFCLGDVADEQFICDAVVSNKRLFLTDAKGTVFELFGNLGIERCRFDTDQSAEKMMVSDNRKYLATSYFGENWLSAIFDISGDELQLIRSGNGQACVSDRHAVQYDTRDGVVWMDMQTKEIHREPNAAGAVCACISMDQEELYVGTYNNELYIYDLKGKNCKRKFMLGTRYETATDTRYIGYRGAQWASAQAEYLPIVVTDDGTLAAYIPGSSVTVYNADSRKRLPCAQEGYYSRFDGEYYLIGRENARLDIFSLRTGEKEASVPGYAKKNFGEISSWGPCAHYTQATYLPNCKKLVAVMADNCVRIWDQETNEWSELESRGKAPWETMLIWDHRRYVQDYPWKNTEPLHCVVMESQILTLTRDNFLRVWNLAGECLFEERCNEINIIWYDVTRMFHIPGTKYCIFVCRDTSRKRSRLYLPYVIRVWNAERWCFIGVDDEECPKRVQGDAILSPAIRPDSILSFKEYGDPLLMNEQELFPEEKIDFVRSLDGVLAWSEGAYVSKNNVVFFSQKKGICVYNRSTGSRIKAMDWAAVTNNRAPVLDAKLSENGAQMGIALADGSCFAIDLNTGNVSSYKSLTVESIDGCDFSGVDMDSEMRLLLRKHGAIINSNVKDRNNKK